MIYLDTSALLKRYIAEAASDAFEGFFMANAPFSISRLTLVEARSALARRRRAGQIDETVESRAQDEIRLDIQDGALLLESISDQYVAEAWHLIGRVAPISLRTLDALHLSIAVNAGATTFVTSDKTLADAARHLGLETHTF
jgi:predicted nucleic acid-binding protein